MQPVTTSQLLNLMCMVHRHTTDSNTVSKLARQEDDVTRRDCATISHELGTDMSSLVFIYYCQSEKQSH